jgi:hypothetical protein
MAFLALKKKGVHEIISEFFFLDIGQYGYKKILNKLGTMNVIFTRNY